MLRGTGSKSLLHMSVAFSRRYLRSISLHILDERSSTNVDLLVRGKIQSFD